MSDQGDLFSFDEPSVHDVPHARTDDPDTSHMSSIATEQVEGGTSLLRPGTTKHLALHHLRHRALTAIEVERISGQRGIWKRVSDLKNAGLVERLDTRRDPLTHREGILWLITERGRSVLDRLDRGEEVRL